MTEPRSHEPAATNSATGAASADQPPAGPAPASAAAQETPDFAVSELRIFVGGLPEPVTKAELLATLGAHGDSNSEAKSDSKSESEDAKDNAKDEPAPRIQVFKRVQYDRVAKSRRRVCFAFVTFATPDAKAAGEAALRNAYAGVSLADAAPRPAKKAKADKKADAKPDAKPAPAAADAEPKKTAVRRTRLDPVDDSIYVDVPNETEASELDELFAGFAPDVKVTLVRKPSRQVRSKSGAPKKLPAKSFAIVFVGRELRDKALSAFDGKEIHGTTLHPKQAFSRVRIEPSPESSNPAKAASTNSATAESTTKPAESPQSPKAAEPAEPAEPTETAQADS